MYAFHHLKGRKHFPSVDVDVKGCLFKLYCILVQMHLLFDANFDKGSGVA